MAETFDDMETASDLHPALRQAARENADRIARGDPFATQRFIELCNGPAEDRCTALHLMVLAGLAEKDDQPDGSAIVTFQRHMMSIIWLDGNKKANAQ